jgi:isopropylmalate/homocitrate/citramalate synthase
MFITDTTFRDGQQARPPYTVEQIVTIFDFLHRLSGPKGVIRQSEFFLYTKKDKEALERCLARGYRYPEITGWIRAVKEDLQLVVDMGLKETGILTSASDYHIFLKLNKTRKEALKDYLDIVRAALEKGIVPRCHFEDITRADIYGFCIPFAIELMKLREESGINVKIRLCDTLGLGVPYPGAALPRSVPRLVRALRLGFMVAVE